MSDPSRHAPWITPPVLALVAANLAPIGGVVFLGWDVFPLLLLFWMENVIVGVLNVPRMLCACPADPMAWAAKMFLVPFFCIHYGLFTFVHGVFVVALFGGTAMPAAAFPDATAFLRIVSKFHLGYAALALLLSHVFSFAWNYIGNGEYRSASPQQLMIEPYGRVVVLHLTILAGGFLMLALDSPVAGLVLLVALKIAIDIAAHLRQHRPPGAPPLDLARPTS
jgi:hypothetical protein